MNDPLYAIGDIHGQIELLEQALEWVNADGGPNARIVFLGDLVDRGPDSKGVIDRLMAGQADGLPWQVLMGNHDRMFARFLTDGFGGYSAALEHTSDDHHAPKDSASH